MNIKLIKEKWTKFYTRGFLTGLMVLCFICLIDQVLQTPFIFTYFILCKIDWTPR